MFHSSLSFQTNLHLPLHRHTLGSPLRDWIAEGPLASTLVEHFFLTFLRETVVSS